MLETVLNRSLIARRNPPCFLLNPSFILILEGMEERIGKEPKGTFRPFFRSLLIPFLNLVRQVPMVLTLER